MVVEFDSNYVGEEMLIYINIHLKLYCCKANALHVTHATFSVDTAEFMIQEQKDLTNTY